MIKNISQFVKTKTFGYILLSLIIIAGFTARLYKIDSPVADWHSWRQADTASVGKIYSQLGINLLYPRYHDISSAQSGIFNPNGYRFVEFPVYSAINALLFNWIDLFTIEVWARLITITSALVTSYFLYLIGKRYLGTAGGILAAFFYLFVPYNIYFTRVILPDPFGTMCAVVSLWFFVKFIDKNNDLNLYFSGLLMALAFLIKPFFVFYLMPLLYLTIKKYGVKRLIKEKNLWLKFGIYIAIMFVPFLLWRAWETRHPEGIPFYSWAFNGDGIRFRPAFWRWIFEERLGRLILGGWGLALFVFGVLRPKQKNLFINYFIFGMFLYVTVVATANVRHDYYQIITIPAISLVLGSGFIYLWNNSVFNKIATRILAVSSLIMMLMIGWGLVKGDYNINHPEIVEAGREVDRITPRDALIVAPYDGDTAFLYQTNRWGWPVMDDTIDNIIAEGADYYVSVNLTDADTKAIESRFKTIEKTDKYIIIDLHKTL